jgi:hypothetical protein
MAIPTTYAPVRPQDFTMQPIQVNKRFTLTSASCATTESGYFVGQGLYSGLRTPIGEQKAANDPTNSLDGSYKHIVWKSLDHQYYRLPYDTMATFEHANRRFTFKFLNVTASLFSCPYLDYGERIKAGSFEYTSSRYNLTDDENGNLYDPAISTGSYVPNYRLVAYWGFNEVFRQFKYGEGGILSDGAIGYQSKVFQPAQPSTVRNVRFEPGVKINSTASGMQASFVGDGYIYSHDQPEFSFDSTEDFTLSFWIHAPVTQSDQTFTRNTVISKRGSVYKQVYGQEPKYVNDQLVTTWHVSSSLSNEATDVFPFHVELLNAATSSVHSGKLRFTRSDGIKTVMLLTTGSITTNAHRHVAITKSGSLVSLYVDGKIHASASDSTLHPINKHLLVFGAENLAGSRAFSGSLDEVRLYDYAATTAELATLADRVSGSLYQTAVVGNLFYRKGLAVVSPLNPRYNDAFTGTWNVAYRGTHTIYQYEVLCRVKKGAFNLTYNPTARRSPKSDFFTDEMTGSLLLPYATSIGMYNDRGELMAIAKLAQPVQMRDDVDLNFLVRWDI